MHKKSDIHNILMWVAPILFFLIVAPFTPYLDIVTSNLFYKPGRGFINNALFDFIFRYGEFIGLSLGIFASIFLLLSFLKPILKKWRYGAMTIVLSLFLGPGLIINSTLKDHWGRPRPRQIENFGGNYLYRPFWQPNFKHGVEAQKSFPSGHVAMGFYFLSLYIVGRRTKNKMLIYSAICLTIVLSSALIITRLAQGGHFLSDVLASPILVWYSILIVDKFTWAVWGRYCLPARDLYTSPKQHSH